VTSSARTLDLEVLAEHQLPDPDAADGKHDRGTVLVAGATAETPGALLLAGLAALRAGAGRLQIAAPAAVAPHLAVRVPEAQVIGLDTDRRGALVPDDRLRGAMAEADAVLIGPGTGDGVDGRPLLAAAIGALVETSGRLAIDAGALLPLRADPEALAPVAERSACTPNAAEAKALLPHGAPDGETSELASELTDRLGCAIAVRGQTTWISAPGQPGLVEQGGTVGLATSGSGDVLAGLVAGHLARGADPMSALIWAVHLHALAGVALVRSGAEVGLLARELVDILPKVRAQLDA
jgi:hydroxyethylthiazole kinase-like uncharacterized protein yjeF